MNDYALLNWNIRVNFNSASKINEILRETVTSTFIILKQGHQSIPSGCYFLYDLVFPWEKNLLGPKEQQFKGIGKVILIP